MIISDVIYALGTIKKQTFDAWAEHDAACITYETDYGKAFISYCYENNKVLEILVKDNIRNKSYIWQEAGIEVIVSSDEEAVLRKLGVPTDSEDDILTKVHAILNNRYYDSRIVLNLTGWTPEMVENITAIAAKQGQSFDEYVEGLIIRACMELGVDINNDEKED